MHAVMIDIHLVVVFLASVISFAAGILFYHIMDARNEKTVIKWKEKYVIETELCGQMFSINMQLIARNDELKEKNKKLNKRIDELQKEEQWNQGLQSE